MYDYEIGGAEAVCPAWELGFFVGARHGARKAQGWALRLVLHFDFHSLLISHKFPIEPHPETSEHRGEPRTSHGTPRSHVAVRLKPPTPTITTRTYTDKIVVLSERQRGHTTCTRPGPREIARGWTLWVYCNSFRICQPVSSAGAVSTASDRKMPLSPSQTCPGTRRRSDRARGTSG